MIVKFNLIRNVGIDLITWSSTKSQPYFPKPSYIQRFELNGFLLVPADQHRGSLDYNALKGAIFIIHPATFCSSSIVQTIPPPHAHTQTHTHMHTHTQAHTHKHTHTDTHTHLHTQTHTQAFTHARTCIYAFPKKPYKIKLTLAACSSFGSFAIICWFSSSYCSCCIVKVGRISEIGLCCDDIWFPACVIAALVTIRLLLD